MKKILTFLILAVMVISCRTNELEEFSTMTFSASMEETDRTKTSLSGNDVLWSSGDKIKIYSNSATNGKDYTLDNESAGQKKGTFTGSGVGSTGPFYAVYPSSIAKGLNGTTVSITLPDTQEYVANSFAAGANPSVSYSSNTSFSFKNLCGIVIVNLTGKEKVTAIDLVTLGNEVLWGEGTIAMNYGSGVPSLNMTATKNSQHKTLRLNCSTPVQLNEDNSTPFYFVVPAGTLSNGFTVKIYDDNFGYMAKSAAANGKNAAERSSYKNMPGIAYQQTSSPFMDLSIYGVYDLSQNPPVSSLTYQKGIDQYAKVVGENYHEFRIQNPAGPKVLKMTSATGSYVEGSFYKLDVKTFGITAVNEYTDLDVKAVKVSGGKIWLLSPEQHIGFILAD